MDFNNNNAIDHKISQFIQKSMPSATTEARNGSEFTRVGEVNSSNSKFEKLRNENANLRPPVPYIRVPNIETAIRQYQTENNEALRQAMRNAGFRSPHTSESSPTFAHFALLAIEEERRRLLNLKASFENERSEMSSGK
mmetsp:Transcript_2920/g.4410  ORF Transcript_2920/g.4410 Transcript_2920/m.4410 type:complete len:139 (+) Transcript_2920:152-568(+)